MTFKPASLYSCAWRAIVALLILRIAWVTALRYFIGSEAPPEPIVANGFANPFLLIHVVGGVTALVLAPLQFVRGIRARWPAVHRVNGRLYLLACAIGAPSAFMLALGTTAGPVAAIGFAIPALLWPVFTWFGWRAAVERRFDAHRDWMLRSYAMPATAITLRLMLPASLMLGYDFYPAYRTISWIAWSATLALAEYAIRRARASAVTRLRLAPA
jgi:uncharacterized membrane protein